MSDTSNIKKLQQRIDELILQIDLGKAEAIERVEESKERLHSVITRLGTVTAQPLKKKLGNLQVQLHLGKMETKDAYLEQRDKIEQAISETGEALKETEVHVQEEFHDAAHALSDKTHMLAINLGAAGILAKEEASRAKASVKSSLDKVAAALKDDAKTAKEKSRQVVDDSRGALQDIRSNLRSLFH